MPKLSCHSILSFFDQANPSPTSPNAETAKASHSTGHLVAATNNKSDKEKSNQLLHRLFSLARLQGDFANANWHTDWQHVSLLAIFSIDNGTTTMTSTTSAARSNRNKNAHTHTHTQAVFDLHLDPSFDNIEHVHLTFDFDVQNQKWIQNGFDILFPIRVHPIQRLLRPSLINLIPKWIGKKVHDRQLCAVSSVWINVHQQWWWWWWWPT